MKNIFIVIILLPVCSFFFNGKSNDIFYENVVAIDKSILHNGDIIFRKGRSFVSQMVLLTDKNSPYSHTGIIYKRNDSVFVIHSVPAEEKGKKDIVKIEPIEIFIKPDRASKILVCRLKDSSSNISVKASQLALNYSKRKVPFDGDFNLENGDKLYCTELIWVVYKKSGLDILDNKFSKSNLPFYKGPIIYPSDLLESKHLAKIFY
ncbi:MAG: hypothetical protein STSR0008_11360 [Ignavibacterium sp.]